MNEYRPPHRKLPTLALNAERFSGNSNVTEYKTVANGCIV